MKASDVMTLTTSTCRSGDDLRSVARAMKEGRCGFLPVVDVAGHARGVVTDRDLALFVAEGAEGEEPIGSTPVERVMSRPVVAVRPDDDLDLVLGVMEKAGVRHLVVEEEGRLVGVISLSGLAQQAAYVGLDPWRLVELLHRLMESPAGVRVAGRPTGIRR